LHRDEDVARFVAEVRAAVPDVELRPYRPRSAQQVLELVYQAVAVAANLGGFLGFCAICRDFLQRKPKYQIELSYLDAQGEQRTSTFTGATADQMESLLQLHLPNTRDGVRIRIQRPAPVAAANADRPS
jgi:hypothetical protein